jgi:hypothetical protein
VVKEVISLPHTELDDEQIKFITDSVLEFLNKKSINLVLKWVNQQNDKSTIDENTSNGRRFRFIGSHGGRIAK